MNSITSSLRPDPQISFLSTIQPRKSIEAVTIRQNSKRFMHDRSVFKIISIPFYFYKTQPAVENKVTKRALKAITDEAPATQPHSSNKTVGVPNHPRHKSSSSI